MLAVVLAWIAVGCLLLAYTDEHLAKKYKLRHLCEDEGASYINMTIIFVLTWPLVYWEWRKKFHE